MPTTANQLDLSLLPPAARREIRDFYHFLLERGRGRKADRTTGGKRSFADLCGQLSWQGDAVTAQRHLRDEW